MFCGAFLPLFRRCTISRKSASGLTPEKIKALVLQSLDDDKAEDVLDISLAGKSSIADYMVIASGRSSRQVASMAQKLAARLESAGIKDIHIEGLENADWVLVDTGDIIVHIFKPEVRAFYQLEKLWDVDYGVVEQVMFQSA